MTRVDATVYGINEYNLDVAQPEIKRALIKTGKRAENMDHIFSLPPKKYTQEHTSLGAL